MEKLYFIPGSQDLYGRECLQSVREDCQKMTDFLNEKLGDVIRIELLPTVETSEICVEDMKKVMVDDDCVGVITWMHTFSPAKMWIKGLQLLQKPLLHLHTQANEKLPYDSIDMDFMNLNQAAHGDREYGFILAKLGIRHEVVAGFYQHEAVIEKIRRFAQVAKAIGLSRRTRVATFGNNMRDVAVTDGNRLECEIKYGWEVKYWGIGEIADLAGQVTDDEIDAKMADYESRYTMATDNVEAVRMQARYQIAFEKFIAANGVTAFTDNFQDLHGLSQLPGLAAQDLMAKGIGFGP
ncbi:MAG: L-arabinose isomerase, partial [Lachnospiraceae bacterium]|nr:L-arabinose isomerase [Lachnospiraceae bacterium]